MIYIIYAYYENPNGRKNLKHFVDNCIANDKYKYYLVVNNHKCTVKVPSFITVIKRVNKGYDFGAWTAALNNIEIKKGDFIILMNDTILGPFSHPSREKNWIDYMCSKITARVKLHGISINVYPQSGTKRLIYRCLNSLKCKNNLNLGHYNPHVQSMLMVFDFTTYQIAKKYNIFDGRDYRYKHQLIIEKEILFSYAILNSGYQISCNLEEYNIDYTKRDQIDKIKYKNNIFLDKCPINIDPTQAIFIKTEGRKYQFGKLK